MVFADLWSDWLGLLPILTCVHVVFVAFVYILYKKKKTGSKWKHRRDDSIKVKVSV